MVFFVFPLFICSKNIFLALDKTKKSGLYIEVFLYFHTNFTQLLDNYQGHKSFFSLFKSSF